MISCRYIHAEYHCNKVQKAFGKKVKVKKFGIKIIPLKRLVRFTFDLLPHKGIELTLFWIGRGV